MERILLIDDNKSTMDALTQIVSEKGFRSMVAINAEDGYTFHKKNAADLIITDMNLPGESGIDLLRRIREEDDSVPIIIITAFGTVESAVQAVKLGAFDFITKPFSVEEIEIKIDKALTTRRLSLKNHQLSLENAYLREEIGAGFSEIVGGSAPMRQVFELVKKVAPANSPALILGESGTGKELVARAIHTNSLRENKPFIKVNCAALASGVLESELFGHEKGAFSGAVRRKPGRFEIAADGSIFLDEIGEISLDVQVKLLRVLQEKEFERVGGTETLKMQARIITATNKNLEELVRQNKFREDLYYRLNVVPVQMPPLREHKQDIPLLINHFIKKYMHESDSPIVDIGPDTLAYLENYDWPGNIRQLENVIERALVMSTGTHLSPEDLPQNILSAQVKSGLKLQEKVENKVHNLTSMVEDYEKNLIYNILKECNSNIAKAARLLNIKRTTLRYKMEKYGLLGYDFNDK
jgi:DNA-binding NtrC family response regulator